MSQHTRAAATKTGSAPAKTAIPAAPERDLARGDAPLLSMMRERERMEARATSGSVDEALRPLPVQRMVSSGPETTQEGVAKTPIMLGGEGLTSGGLPAALRAKMERSFGADFSDVSVKVDRRAHDIGARAFTQGNRITVGPGEFQPGTRAGESLIGHELTHVLQQRAGLVSVPQGKGGLINADPALESEADRAGDRASMGSRADASGRLEAMGRAAPGGRHTGLEAAPVAGGLRRFPIQRARRSEESKETGGERHWDDEIPEVGAHPTAANLEDAVVKLMATRDTGKVAINRHARYVPPTTVPTQPAQAAQPSKFSDQLKPNALNVVGEDHDVSGQDRFEEAQFCRSVVGGQYWTETNFPATVGAGAAPADRPALRIKFAVAITTDEVRKARESAGDQKLTSKTIDLIYFSRDSIARDLNKDIVKNKEKLSQWFSSLSGLPAKPPASGSSDDQKAVMDQWDNAVKTFPGGVISPEIASWNRGLKMSKAARAQADTPGVWKVGEVHAKEMGDPFMGESIPFTLMHADRFRILLKAWRAEKGLGKTRSELFDDIF